MYYYHIRFLCHVSANPLADTLAHSFECVRQVDWSTRIEYFSDIDDIQKWAPLQLNSTWCEVLDWKELKGKKRPSQEA